MKGQERKCRKYGRTTCKLPFRVGGGRGNGHGNQLLLIRVQFMVHSYNFRDMLGVLWGSLSAFPTNNRQVVLTG